MNIKYNFERIVFMKISYNGINDLVVSFYATENVKEGDLVQLSDNYTVDVASSDEIFTGVCLSVQGGIAAVQLNGFVERAYIGEAPVTGVTFFAADGNGNVKCVNAGLGRNAIVLAVDTAEKTVKFLLY